MVRIADLYEPLDRDALTELRTSILNDGQQSPIIRDARTGEILAGRNRERVCRELGIEPEYRDVECADEAGRLAVAIAHNPARQMVEAERDAAIVTLREAGWSARRIAGLLRIRQTAVTATASAEAVAVIGADGRRDAARKPTTAELDRRREAVAKLRAEGHGTDAIAEALGVSSSTVVADMRARGMPKHKRSRGGPEAPPPIDWRDKAPPRPRPSRRYTPPPPPPSPSPPPTPPAAYQLSALVHEVERFNQGAQEDDYVKSYACQVEEALRAGDDRWTTAIAEGLRRMHGLVGEMVRISTDPDYRASVAYSIPRTTMVDDAGPVRGHLRSVEGGAS